MVELFATGQCMCDTSLAERERSLVVLRFFVFSPLRLKLYIVRNRHGHYCNRTLCKDEIGRDRWVELCVMLPTLFL